MVYMCNKNESVHIWKWSGETLPIHKASISAIKPMIRFLVSIILFAAGILS